MAQRKYNCMDRYLDQFTRKNITPQEDAIKQYNEALKEILHGNLLPSMIELDPLFKGLFKRVLYSGSYYENLRISLPNEFDLNMEISFPAQIKVSYSTDHPGFAILEVQTPFDENILRKRFRNDPNISRREQQLLRLLDHNSCISREAVIKWIKSVVDQALRTIDLDYCKISRSTSGPAITLNVTFNDERLVSFSVDLVPVFLFDVNILSPQIVRLLPPSGDPNYKLWAAVPKQPLATSDVRFWRMSFYTQEGLLMNNHNNMKKVLKLIKWLRDKNNWTSLSSYYIKTIFLLELEEKGASFWNNGVGFLFMHMLERLEYYFKELKAIPFYWDRGLNLLNRMRYEEKINIGNHIAHMRGKIDRNLPDNPEYVLTILSPPRPKGYVPESSASQELGSTDSSQESSGWLKYVMLGVASLGLAALLGNRARN